MSGAAEGSAPRRQTARRRWPARLLASALPAGVLACWPAACAAGVVVAGPVPPSVAYVGVESGQAGTSVPILGSALADASAVAFGGRAATGFTVISAIEIVAIAPAGSGTVNVTVTTPAGTSRAAYGDLFSYLPAPPSSPSPSSPSAPAAAAPAALPAPASSVGAAAPAPPADRSAPVLKGRSHPRARHGASCGARPRHRCRAAHRRKRSRRAHARR